MIRRLAILAALALAGCGGSGADTRLGTGDEWPAPGGDSGKSHYSTLTDINAGNVGQLGLAWEYDLGSNRVQEATPVVVGGVLYTSGNLGRVYALDAATGRELWKFEPEVDMQVNRFTCCDQANRGVAVVQGKVIVGALDGMLYALDAKTGAVAWKVDTVIDHKRGYTSTGAPEVAGDLVVIGNAGAEYDTRGYVTAYRIADGGQAWRFFTIPRDPKLGPPESPAMEAALKTWDRASRWDIGGGGTAWDAINYDPRFGTIYVGVGNGGPYLSSQRSPKGGDNLYLSSIVALDARTGALKWHYQETPQDSWDYTATQPMILADLEVGGSLRPVILHSPKNGFLFVIDRETGKPLAISPLVRTSWASGYDLATGRPKLTPERSDFGKGPKLVFPSAAGARNWYPAAYDPERKSYFANVLDQGNLIIANSDGVPHRPQALNTGGSLIFGSELAGVLPTLPPPVAEAVNKLPEMQWIRDKPFSNELRAIDPLTGKSRWAVPLAGWQDRMGVLATKAGLIFHGTVGGAFQVRDSGSGKLLKSLDTGTSIMAAPMTYKINSVQYVAVAAGWGGGGFGFVPRYGAAYRYGNANRLLVFKLGGSPVRKPAELPPLEPAPAPPAQLAGATPEMIGRGAGLFYANCALCHANQPRSVTPDLRRMQPGTHAAFREIVLGGALQAAGMPRWDDVLKPEDADAIHAWLIAQQGPLHASETARKKAGQPIDSNAPAVLSNY